ncbi:unnamed protein product [Ostreobium quekettii]|uniref:PH domain-containing protein n=1 Tax=Ostreobium quekettii TaxID=121088 RepID=A0A8S1IKV4_9CHLO|nr:unnamed protein product [Ostreobium quekettii]|eukprot:evm.model.scf_171.6 EVM.evm.TU.scf_171.6   scf_171:48820-49764(-)
MAFSKGCPVLGHSHPQGNNLFYFKNSKALSPSAVIPLEYAEVEAMDDSDNEESPRFVLDIRLHTAYGPYCKKTTFKLSTFKLEVQSTWLAAFKQAIVPRHDLVTELRTAGR